MLTELVQLLPGDLGGGLMIVALIGAAMGAGLWIVGVRVSRPLITLVTVLLGAGIGLQIPRWIGSTVSGAGPAVCGAVVLGVSGFVLHRMWIGIGLGFVISVWASSMIWVAMNGNSSWTWPAVDETSTVTSYARSAWENVPPNVARLAPWACGVAMVSALAAVILWPKLTTAFHWSATGLSLVVGSLLLAVSVGGHDDWLARVPQSTWAQLLVLIVLLAAGTFVQWKLSPKTASVKATVTKDPD